MRRRNTPNGMEQSAWIGYQRSFKNLRYLLTLLLLGLAVHILLSQLASLEHALVVLRQMSPLLVALAVGAQIASYVGSGYLLQAGVGLVQQRITVRQGIVITLAANSMGLLAGGTVTSLATTIRRLHRLGINNSGASLASSIPLIFNNLFLLLISWFGLVYLLIAHELSFLQFTAFAVIAMVFLAISILLSWSARNRSRVLTLLHRIGEKWADLLRRTYQPALTKQAVDEFYRAWEHLRQGEWQRPAIGALLNNGFDVLTLYILFAAAGYPLSIGLLIVGYGLPLLLGKIGLLPGGLGVIEGTMAAIYSGFAVPDAILVVVILAYRFLSFWLPTLLGFVLILLLRSSERASSADDEG